MTRGILKMTVCINLLYGGRHRRVYRYLDDRVDPMGSFMKKAGRRMTELSRQIKSKQRLVLRVRTVADTETSMLTLVFQSFLPSRLSARQDLGRRGFIT